MNDNKKQTIILTLIAIITLSLVAIGAAYAFFASQTDGKGETNVNVTTGTTDVLSFNLEDKDVNSDSIKDEDNEKAEINITANMSNFKQDDLSVGDGVIGTATLIANDATNSASDTYNIYLYISKNEFKYTNYQNEAGEMVEGKEENGQIVAPDEEHTTKVSELILTITQPGEEGELTHIEGLDYKTNVDGKGLNGFDITEANDLITIIKDNVISAEKDPVIQNWEIKVTFINLDANQNKNTSKKFKGQIIMQKGEYVYEYQKTINKLLELANKEGETPTLIKHNTAELNSKYPDMANKELNANDDAYRYSGSSASVKNYVCLDGTTTEKECSSDADLYRIIGLFPNETGKYEMKLIKYDYVTKDALGDNETAPGGAYKGNYTFGNTTYQGNPDNYNNIAGYYWNYTGSGTYNNMWQKSNLNQINLNQFYYNYIASKVTYLSEHITENKWTTGGFSYSDYNVQQVYNNELGTEKLQAETQNCYDDDYNTGERACTEDDLTYKNVKIGLMYVSDYGYAAYPEAWNQTITNESGYGSEIIKENNWMYMGLYEWTVSRDLANGSNAGIVSAAGRVYSGSVISNNVAVRPSFYLDSSTKITSGDGSKTNPFRLSWN